MTDDHLGFDGRGILSYRNRRCQKDSQKPSHKPPQIDHSMDKERSDCNLHLLGGFFFLAKNGIQRPPQKEKSLEYRQLTYE